MPPTTRRTGGSNAGPIVTGPTATGPQEGPAQEEAPFLAGGPEGETQDTAAKADTPPQTVVRYLGDQVTRAREINIRDWRAAGVSEEQEPRAVRWGPENNWEIPMSDLDFLTKEQFGALINVQNGFEVLEK